MSSNNIHSLKEIINQLIELKDWGEGIAFAKIKEEWIEIVGENFAEHIEPQKLKDGVLHLKADSSTWRTEMLIRKQLLIDKLNSFCGKNIIKSIKIR
jgi:predicted nucleic acid-binding Zn ribbon protein